MIDSQNTPVEALIFAGGVGRRMGASARPKQFLELAGRPIIDFTIAKFAEHPQVTGVTVVCIESWISFLCDVIEHRNYGVPVHIVAGGASGQESIYNGLVSLRSRHPGDESAVVLVHDGVRPIIDDCTISSCIASVKEHGCTATVVPAIETIVLTDNDGSVSDVIPRSRVNLARAPQGFFTEELYKAHLRAKEDELEFIDSISLMSHYGYKIYTVEGNPENIKVTTPMDYYAFRGYMDALDQRLLWKNE